MWPRHKAAAHSLRLFSKSTSPFPNHRRQHDGEEGGGAGGELSLLHTLSRQRLAADYEAAGNHTRSPHASTRPSGRRGGGIRGEGGRDRGQGQEDGMGMVGGDGRIGGGEGRIRHHRRHHELPVGLYRRRPLVGRRPSEDPRCQNSLAGLRVRISSLLPTMSTRPSTALNK